jgi:hypothetical protein
MAEMKQMEAEVPFDPYDLPGYAGRLVRLHERQPEIMRLCTWQRLERTARATSRTPFAPCSASPPAHEQGGVDVCEAQRGNSS